MLGAQSGMHCVDHTLIFTWGQPHHTALPAHAGSLTHKLPARLGYKWWVKFKTPRSLASRALFAVAAKAPRSERCVRARIAPSGIRFLTHPPQWCRCRREIRPESRLETRFLAIQRGFGTMPWADLRNCAGRPAALSHTGVIANDCSWSHPARDASWVNWTSTKDAAAKD